MILARDRVYEENFPTEQPKAAPDPRFPGANAYPGREGRDQKTAPEGAEAPCCLRDRDQRFPPAVRVRKSTEYRRIYDGGRKIVRRGFVLFYLPNGTPDHRLGITVTKRVGDAVTRNRYKRRIRDSFRRKRQELGPIGVDFIVHVRHAFGDLSGGEWEKEFRWCGARVQRELERG
jgi:ribonuclease P protein component